MPDRPILLYDLCAADEAVRFSPHCWKAKLALAHKGLAFETVPTPFTGIAAIGGGGFTKTVPVIDDNGRLVKDSFAVAEYLDDTYPDRPTLFGANGRALARYVETVHARTVHTLVMRMMVADIHDRLAPADRAYFRESREVRLGTSLEDYQEGVEALKDAFRRATDPVRHALTATPWLGGHTPLFVDYIVAGALLWVRAITGAVPLEPDDPVAGWFERILDLHDGLARNAPVSVRAA